MLSAPSSSHYLQPLSFEPLGMLEETPPTADDFRNRLYKSITYKGNETKNIPIVKFIVDWNDKLDRGWLRKTLAPGLVDSSSRLSNEERIVVVYLCSFLCGGRLNDFTEKLAHCFDTSESSIRRIAKEIFESSLLPSPREVRQEDDHVPLLAQAPTKKADLRTTPFFSRENMDARVDPVMDDMQFATPSLISDQYNIPVTPPSPARLTSIFNECFDTPQRNNTTTPLSVDSAASKTGFVRRIVNSVKKAKRKVGYAANTSTTNLANSVQKIRRRIVLKRRPTTASQQMRQTQTHNNSDSNTQESQTQTQDNSDYNTQEESTEILSQAIGTQTHINSDSNTQESQTQTQDNSDYNTQEESTELILSQAIGIVNGVLQAEEVNDLTTSKQLNALAVKILAKANGNDEDVFELKYVIPTAKGYSTKVKMFAEIPVPRRSSTKEAEEKSNQSKTIERRAKKVGKILERLCPTTEECKLVLVKLVKGQGGSLFWEPFFLGIADIIAIRLSAGGTSASTNMILRVLGAVGKLIGVTNFLAPQAKKRIGDFERNALPIEFKIATCNIAQGKEAACVFYWIENIPLLIERLVCSSIVAGKQQPSIEFSSFKDHHIIYDNIDRGGGDLIHMLRNGNREDGNTAEYCIPISVVEGASEDHANLKKTVLSKDRGEVVQMMLDKKLSIIEIHVPECGDVRCIIMELVSSQKIEQVTVGLLEDEIFHQSIDDEGYEEFRRCSVISENRKLPDKIVVPSDTAALENLDGGRWHLTLSLQMVRIKTDDVEQSSYVGCRLPDFDYSFKFDLPIILSKESEAIWAKCMPVICFPGHDGKMMTHVCGLGTCGVTFPCPCCIRRRDCQSLPAWAGIEFPEEVEGLTCEDFPLRKGKYSYATLSAISRQRLGPKHEFSAAAKESTIPKATINATYSVNSEILQRLEPELINCDGMHITQGYMTHLTEETALMLAEIFKDGGWAEKNKEAMQERAEKLVSTKQSSDYSSAMKRDNACKRMYNAAAQQLVEAEKQCADSESRLDGLKLAAAVVELEFQDAMVDSDSSFEAAGSLETAKEEVVEAEEECINAATRMGELALELENLAEKRESESEDSGFGFMNRLIKGGKEMLSLIESGPTNKRLRKLNQPEYLFLQSVRKYAGSFNKQHGSMELTHGRGMNALEHREAIYTLTCEGIKDDDDINKKKVKEVMDWWLKMAGYLLEISKFSKSQKKATDERLKNFKLNLVRYGVAWRKRIRYKNPVFWKMMVAECAFVSWVSWTRISGKGDAQGFENKHHQMNGMRALLASMVNTGQRVAKLSQRQQIFLFHEISEKMEFIENKTERTGKRQPYKTKGKSTRALEDVDALESDELDQEFIELENGGLLPEEMSAFYNFYKRSHMPEEWYEPIQNFVSLGSKAKNEARYFE
jgi:hypothetical protein